MAISKDKNGLYIVSYSRRHPISRVPVSRRRVGIKSMPEARRVLNELVIKINDLLTKNTVPTWECVVNAFEAAGADLNLSISTVENYVVCARSLTLPEWKNKLIDTINGNDIRNLVSIKLKDKSAQHQKSSLKHIRKIFQFAFEQGLVRQNPTPIMKFRGGDKIKSVLTEIQARNLLERASELDHEWFPHWAVALHTGMRSGELYALTWDKVSFETRQIKVDSSWNNKEGFKSTKSNDDRIVEIASSLEPILKELKLQSNGSPFVLPRHSKWDKGEQARELRMFLAGMGLPRIRFHDLRATWATILLSKGVEPIKIMKMGGWKDMKTMMIYARMAGVDVRGATDSLNLYGPIQKRGQILEFSTSL